MVLKNKAAQRAALFFLSGVLISFRDHIFGIFNQAADLVNGTGIAGFNQADNEVFDSAWQQCGFIHRAAGVDNETVEKSFKLFVGNFLEVLVLRSGHKSLDLAAAE